MVELDIWYLDETKEGYYTLFAPNGIALFNVSLDTLEMLGRMFLDVVGAENDDDT